jgi:hypothetical protein
MADKHNRSYRFTATTAKHWAEHRHTQQQTTWIQGRPFHSNDEAECFMEKVGGTKIMRKMTKTWGKDEILGGKEETGKVCFMAVGGRMDAPAWIYQIPVSK